MTSANQPVARSKNVVVQFPWAKLRRTCQTGRGNACRMRCGCAVDSALSLIGHSADVAAVMQALLEQPVIARRLATLLGRSALKADDRARLVALTALHDIGKVNLGFQLAPFEHPIPRAGHIGPMLALLYGERHADRQVLQALTADGGLGRLAHLTHGHSDNPFRAVLAHHGALPASNGFVDPAVWRSRDGYDPIIACRDLVAAILHWLPEAAQEAPIAWTPAFGHAFAGLVTLADWLGSDETKFPFGMGVLDGVDRFAASLQSARDLVMARGLSPEPERARARACSWEPAALTGHATPSPAQSVMLALPPAAEQGRIGLIEDETGSGKTEAALIHFLDLFRQGRVDGLYFALPTRAAARQIHSRLKDALHRLLGPDTPHVTLAVPGYRDPAAVELAAPDALYPDDAAEARRDALWSAERPKRYLASWVAVGTIDQLLLGGLRVRHATLRSAAMLRLLLVVDEVHGSDIYMGAVLRGVLAQHQRAGGHALLMSATLGASARTKFFKLSQQRTALPDHKAAVSTPYPAVWMDGAVVAHPASGREPRRIAVVLEDAWDRMEALITRAVAAARAGARVLVIRNTVRLVIETQRALEAVAPDLSFRIGTVAAPHHARYAPEDRMRLDKALEAVLGPKAARERGSVTIASQTAEQSLDIDADLLITDLCPADVLLQRIGRLHRHPRPRPPGFEQPKVIVLAPPEDSLAASLGTDGVARRGPLALGLVYADLLGVLATRRALAARPVLHIPSDNRALVEAATHETQLKELGEALGGVWHAHWQALWGKKSAESQLADRFLIKWTKAIEPPLSDEAIKTRLGLDDRTVMLEGTIGPFGEPISLVSLRGDWIAGVPPETQATVSRRPDGALEITLDDRAFVYDRLGLRKATDL